MWLRWLVRNEEVDSLNGVAKKYQTRELQIFVDGKWTKVPETTENDFKVDCYSKDMR